MTEQEMKKKILIVEDNVDLLGVLEKTIEVLGYDSVVTTSGQQAVDLAARQLPDLIMLDISLQETDGFQAASMIRKNPKTQYIPILAVTGRSSTDGPQEYLQCGFNDFIIKPFTRGQLHSHIRNLLKWRPAPTLNLSLPSGADNLAPTSPYPFKLLRRQ